MSAIAKVHDMPGDFAAVELESGNQNNNNHSEGVDVGEGFFSYPHIGIDKWNATWLNERIKSSKDDGNQVFSDIKAEILGGMGSIAVTLALLITVAIPFLLANPCSDTPRQFKYSDMCEVYHVVPWALATCCSFVGIVNVTNLYAHAMFAAPTERGVGVLLAFPRMLGGRDALTQNMIYLCSALIVDAFINYKSPVWAIVYIISVVSYLGYHVSDAVYHAGSFGVSNQYRGNDLWGAVWYNLFAKEKIKFKSSARILCADASTFVFLIPLLLLTAVPIILNYSVN